MKKKLFAVLTAMILVISVFPSAALAAAGTFFIGDTELIDEGWWYEDGIYEPYERAESDSYVYFDGESTIIMHNAVINIDNDETFVVDICGFEDLDIILEGSNMICSSSLAPGAGTNETYYGLSIESSNVTVSAADQNASLDILVNYSPLEIYNSTITLAGGKITCIGQGIAAYLEDSSLTVNGGEFDADNTYYYGLDVDLVRSSLAVTGGSVTIGDEEFLYEEATGIALEKNSSVTVSGGTVNVFAGTGIAGDSMAYDIMASISGKLYRDAVPDDSSCDVTVSGGTLSITASALGISIKEGSVAVTGGTLNITALPEEGIAGGISIETGDVTVSDGYLKVIALYCIAINETGSVSFNGGKTQIEAVDNNHPDLYPEAIYVYDGDVRISNGNNYVASGLDTVRIQKGDLDISGGQNWLVSPENSVMILNGDLNVSGGQNEIQGGDYALQAYHGSALFTGGTTHFYSTDTGIACFKGITLDGTVIKEEGYVIDGLPMGVVSSLTPVGTDAFWTVFIQEIDSSMELSSLYDLVAPEFTIIPDTDNPKTGVSASAYLYMLLLASVAVLFVTTKKVISLRTK